MRKGLSKTGITLMLALVVAIGSFGCATTAANNIVSKSDIGPDVVTALTDLKAKIQPLIQVVGDDAKATRLWADGYLGPNGKAPDALKYQLALACPAATDAVGAAINGTIDDLIAQIQGMSGPTDPEAPKGRLMLFLTQLKYGAAVDPKAKLDGLKAKLALQTDTLFTGCAHLFPKKQVNDIIKLLGKAGVVGISGGSLAPVMGILP